MIRTPRQRLRLALLRIFACLPRAGMSQLPRLDGPSWLHAPRILVIRPDHLGDLLFTTPTLRVLRQRFPDARITALVGSWGAPVLSRNPYVDEIVTLPFPGFSRQTKPSLWQPYRLLYSWAQRLQDRFDLAFVLRFDHWWGALLAYQARVPQRVGYAVLEVAPFLSHAMPYVAGRHEVEQNLRLADWKAEDWDSSDKGPPTDRPAACSIADHPLEFHVPEPAVAWARSLVRSTSPIAIHPGAGAAIKLWSTEGWALVADVLAHQIGVQILLTGSEAERPLCQEIAAQMETPAWVVAGETSLDQLAALFSQCRLVLGLDSGPLHLAVAVGTPTVHLYGPVDPAAFGPWGLPERHRVLVSAWPCIPCNRLDYHPDELVYHPCVREIGVNEVLDAASQGLRSR